MAKLDEKKIAKLMTSLEITREQAIELLEFDNGDTDNEEVDLMEGKAKAQEEVAKPSKKKGSSLDKVKHQKAQKKIDVFKENIFNLVEGLTNDYKDVFVNPQKLTSTKLTFMDIDGNFYSISLTKHKEKPDGYSVSE